MERRAALLTVMLLAVSFPMAAGAESGMFVGGQATPLAPAGGIPAPSSSIVAPELPAVMPGQNQSMTVFRDIPSISGRYSVGGTTLMPYLGAGFSNGYTSDLDRSLNTGTSSQSDTHLRSLFGQNLAPNEFQMGIRIPF
ncbi:MAG TPA: hypothetical protein VJ746_05500 [Nitrospira sp.]|nr:hypothetical protein [Nitrospira sp.]